MLLIDEIDKADIEFPNDLLHELDRMRFVVEETGEEVAAKHRPVVIITSNAEKELPDAFLRRCVFHFIDFPTPELMRRIVDVHHPQLDASLATQAIETFYELRSMKRLRKRPSTSELVDWIAVLERAGVRDVKLDQSMPFLGTLLKKEQDLVALADQLAGGRAGGPDAEMIRPVPLRAARARRAGGDAGGARARAGAAARLHESSSSTASITWLGRSWCTPRRTWTTSTRRS